jgi:IS30 family transposase
MPSITQAPLSGRFLSFAVREEIAILHARECGVREIARRTARSPSTISRELRRNAATRGGSLEYRATTAQWHADRRARRPEAAKLCREPSPADLRAGPASWDDHQARWRGCAGPGRAVDRTAPQAPGRPLLGRVVEPGANRLRIDFPDDESIRVSHEAIYQALYVQGRGALRRELTACLRGRVPGSRKPDPHRVEPLCP